jgi:hypothetical protein
VPQRLSVRTLGGVLPQENLGMAASGSASFAVGEEVLVFLTRQGGLYRVAGGERGKYVVEDGTAAGDAQADRIPLESMMQRIQGALLAEGRTPALPADWSQRGGCPAGDEVLRAATPTWQRGQVGGTDYGRNVPRTPTAARPVEAAGPPGLPQRADRRRRTWSNVPSATSSFLMAGRPRRQRLDNGFNEVPSGMEARARWQRLPGGTRPPATPSSKQTSP